MSQGHIEVMEKEPSFLLLTWKVDKRVTSQEMQVTSWGFINCPLQNMQSFSGKSHELDHELDGLNIYHVVLELKVKMEASSGWLLLRFLFLPFRQ